MDDEPGGRGPARPLPPPPLPVHLDLRAVIVTVVDEQPHVLVTAPGPRPALPASGLDTLGDDTLELAIRRIVRSQTGVELAYVEQLYTFGDAGREPGARLLTVAYLALTRDPVAADPLTWVGAYDLFPWEDHRGGRPEVLERAGPRLARWAGRDAARAERVARVLPPAGAPWDPVAVLERYELLYEVGLGHEAAADRGRARAVPMGRPLRGDDRRIVATALGRLRGKITWRPLVFELLPDRFTLPALQGCVESLAGRRLHTPNFRRLVESGGLVERVGARARTGPGRPAELHRFRREVLRERASFFSL